MSRQCRIVTRPQHDETLARFVYLVLLLPLMWTTFAMVGGDSAAAADRRQLQLTLSDATALALQQNLDIQISGLAPRIQEAQVTEQKGIYDVTVNGAFTASNSRLLTDSASFRFDPPVRFDDGSDLAGQEDELEQEFSLGLSQLTPWGGTYELEFSEARRDSNRRLIPNLTAAEEQRADLYKTEVELQLTQPLLKDFGNRVTSNQILIARNNLSISHEDFRRQVISSTSQVQQTYWDLVFRRQDLEVQRQQLALAGKLLSQVRRQVEVGTLAPIEVLQAETDIARINQRIIIAINAVRDAED